MAVRLKDRIEANIRQSDKVNSSLSIQLNSGTATVYDGSAAKSINITPDAIGAAAAGHTHNNIISSGTMTMISGTAKWANGFTVGNIYQSGYPFNYGTTWMYQGTFGAELIFNGVGGDAGAGTGHMYFRTRSDWATSTWGDWKHLLDSSNYTTYTVTKTGTGASGSWGISITGNAATATQATSIKDSGDGRTLYMNYSAAGMTSTSWLGSWNGNTLQAIAPSVLNVGSATKLQTARSIFGKSFNGTADIAGKPLVYGAYTSTASARYANSGIEVRENGLVGNAQSDIGYAPAIGFHWSGRIAATFLFHSDGIFYLRKQDGTSRATLDANLNGNCYGTANYATNAYFLQPQSDIVYGRNSLQYFNASLGTTASATANYGPTADWYHIIRMNHGNANGYYVELAACFHNDNFYFRRVASGTNSGFKHIWVEGNSVTSAVWNDYAEYRESDCQEFGRVLVENGDDSLSVSDFRLQPFAGVSSDTWGFCQGETEKAKTPIAVAGRVLAYPYQNRNNYKPGDCVCAAPNGTVDIMTRQEVIQYPDRIVGTVSCIPDYEEWGQGDRPAVKVDGRIWIKVR